MRDKKFYSRRAEYNREHYSKLYAYVKKEYVSDYKRLAESKGMTMSELIKFALDRLM